jgi:UDP-N-acetylglucosamine 4,6-dehydratase
LKIWISGITGTLGQVVCRMLMARGHEIVGYSRDEQKQSLLPKDDNLTLYLGDIRDRDRVQEATRGVDIIMHFASHKMVDVLEHNPEEAASTIILGTQNVLHAQRMNRIPKVVFTSTDKAVYPINVYGACKKVAECHVLRNPNNAVCRYGNVLGSRGSILPKIIKSLKEEGVAELTSNRMTRFWITIEQAAGFVISSAMNDTGLCIPPIESASVMRVIDAVAQHIGVPAYSFKEIGIRPGEKLHECLMTSEESKSGQAIYSDDEEMSDDALTTLIGESIR